MSDWMIVKSLPLGSRVLVWFELKYTARVCMRTTFARVCVYEKHSFRYFLPHTNIYVYPTYHYRKNIQRSCVLFILGGAEYGCHEMIVWKANVKQLQTTTWMCVIHYHKKKNIWGIFKRNQKLQTTNEKADVFIWVQFFLLFV